MTKRKEGINIRNINKIIEECRKNTPEGLIDKSIIRLPQGSFYIYIHEDWFIRALNQAIITENSYGQFVPLVPIEYMDKIVGKRGKVPIFEKAERLNYTRLNQFIEEYDKFRYTREQEAQANDSLVKKK